MRLKAPTLLLTLPALTVALFLASCGGPGSSRPPQPGTPAFNWMTAKEAFSKGDYLKANDLLVTLTEKENEYRAQAMPLALVLSHGVSQGYMELNETLAEGTKKARTGAAVFRGLTNEYRAKATATGMRYIEVARRFNGSKPAGAITLIFGFPEGPADDPPQYQKISIGQMVPEADVVAMERDVLRHHVMLSAVKSVGGGKDAAKGRKAYENGEAKVAAGVFLFALGEGLSETADMYGLKKLNQPGRILKAIHEEALAAFALAPDNKETKALIKKSEEALKKIKE